MFLVLLCSWVCVLACLAEWCVLLCGVVFWYCCGSVSRDGGCCFGLVVCNGVRNRFWVVFWVCAGSVFVASFVMWCFRTVVGEFCGVLCGVGVFCGVVCVCFVSLGA